MSDRLDTSTLMEAEAPLSAEVPPRPALTVLAHPYPARVGDRHVFDGSSVMLSRVEPELVAPGRTAGSPLGDPYVSRTPVRLSRTAAGGMSIAPTEGLAGVVVDGRPCAAPVTLTPAELDRGVTLELGGRVALLVHRCRNLPPNGPALGLVGASDRIVKLRTEIARVADLDVSVLVRGETGSGKELVAQALHSTSARRTRPFLAVNMASVPATLAASELFGHERGAFSGADRRHEGLFVRADGGTVFLDEIGDAPVEVQVMLLRALETREIQPVGAPRAQKVNVRVVAATDADLEQAVATGNFRAPLLHRLGSYRIDVPPLRTRRDDVGRLFFHFATEELMQMGEAHRLAPRTQGERPFVPAGLVAALARHDWPGNVRELRNVVRHLFIANRGANELAYVDLLPRLLGPPSRQRDRAVADRAVAETLPPSPAAPAPRPRVYRKPDEVTEEEISEALAAHKYRLKPTAQALGVSRTTLYALMDRFPRLRRAAALSREELEAALAHAGGDLDRAAESLRISRAALLMRLTALGLR